MTQSYDPRTDPEAERRPPLNGCTLLASCMVEAGRPRGGYIVLVDRNRPDFPDRYITGWVKKLTDPEWVSGNYFNRYRDALRDMVGRTSPVPQ